ncbi:DnaJ [Acrasis kona]|uniref:DnaJ n=1 Tax=Acrasis kona TaxID=1008807 RepID=A0AAW2ZIX1_9EUKA
MNKDAAIDYLIVAHNALQSKDYEKSSRLVRKALSLDSSLCPRKEDLISSQCHLFARFNSCEEILTFINESSSGKSKSSQTRQQTKPKVEEEPEEIRYTDADVKEVKEMLAKQGNHYKVLGLEKSATADDVKRAYRKLALKFHPDRNTAPHSAEAFKLVSSAYVVLSDEAKRSRYDRFGTDEEQAANMQRNPFGHGMQGGHFHFNGDEDMFDLFSQMFGQDIMFQRRPTRQQQNVQYNRMRQSPRARQQHQREEESGGGIFYIIQMIVIGLIIFTSIFNVGFGNRPSSDSSTPFSYEKTAQHTMQRSLQVSRSVKIPYWTSKDINNLMNYRPRDKQTIEQSVYQNYEPYLREKCNEDQDSDECTLLEDWINRRYK